MKNRLTDHVADGATVVVGSGLASRQLEAYLDQANPNQRAASITPAIRTYQSWTAALWSKTAGDSRHILTRNQSESLWRCVVGDSTVGERLISSRNASRWASEAWEKLWQWQIDPEKLQANEDDTDFASFLGWARSYRRTLADNGWIDASLAEIELIGRDRLDENLIEAVVWADMPEATPAQKALYRRLERDGWPVSKWEPPVVSRSSVRLALQDVSTELSAAAQWAAERLSQRPSQRLALVIPDLRARRHEVDRVLEDTLDPERVLLGSSIEPCFFNPSGESVELHPAIGAAMTALELVSTRGTFQSLSRWLRSPYFHHEPGDLSERAIIEASLRTDLSAQLRFRQAFLAGSFAKHLRGLETELATRLSLALRTVDSAPQHATPTRWIRVWQQILSQLGWLPEAQTAPGSVLAPWESALNSLSMLTPILGSISMTEALDELDLILSRPRAGGPIPLMGISVLERLEDVGPGYDAIWLAGMTDNFWPRPTAVIPLLPLKLQRAHDMPGSSPGNGLELCRRATARVIERVPDLVFSWPGHVHDYPSEPSPLLAGIADVTLDNLVDTVTPRRARHLAKSCALETVDDKAPRLDGTKIAGGASTLDTQASCPLRAFIERRLDARPLDNVARGLGPRQRGIATHKALELLLRRLPGQAELIALQPAERDTWAAECTEKALQESFGTARSLLPTIYRLEFERLLRTIASLLENDRMRQSFRVEAVEERQVAEISGYRLSCRLDRIDRLDAGGTAVIDYKTGSKTSPADWFRSRLIDTQLPLYAQIAGNNVTAVIIAAVHADRVQYRGFWNPKDEFPGNPSRLPGDSDWPTQLTVWREQLETLVTEFASGDTRILTHDLDAAAGAYAPLTRVIEQRSLARAATAPRDAI